MRRLTEMSFFQRNEPWKTHRWHTYIYPERMLGWFLKTCRIEEEVKALCCFVYETWPAHKTCLRFPHFLITAFRRRKTSTLSCISKGRSCNNPLNPSWGSISELHDFFSLSSGINAIWQGSTLNKSQPCPFGAKGRRVEKNHRCICKANYSRRKAPNSPGERFFAHNPSRMKR